jgi:ectoine hydroxylase-related dioxygenase (phytanoyl-CoA dioxygenase family)
MQDNVIWKPVGARPLGFHQDNSYLDWFTPSETLTCWISLDDTTAEGGTMEVVRGSHRWGNSRWQLNSMGLRHIGKIWKQQQKSLENHPKLFQS